MTKEGLPCLCGVEGLVKGFGRGTEAGNVGVGKIGKEIMLEDIERESLQRD